MMRINAYLMVSRNGNIRVLKTGGGVRPNEIRIQLNITVPDVYFTRPEPVVAISLPEIEMPDDMETVIEITADTVARALNVDVTEVRDGLTDAVRHKHEIETGSK
jgi:hypothetical protein